MNPLFKLSRMICLLALCAGTPSWLPAAGDEDEEEEAELLQITDNNILFVYEAHADIPSPREDLISFLSSEFRSAKDEFSRKGAYDRAVPILERRLKEASEAETVTFTIGVDIPVYDFNRGGFVLNVNSDTFYPFNVEGRNYAIILKPSSKFSFVPVSKERAQQLAKKLGASRRGYYEVYGTVRKAEELRLNHSITKTVVIRPQILKLYTDDKTLIGETAGASTQK